jgi:hypothetical protein
MSKLHLPPPSPSIAVALVALFISLGGVSYGLATGSIDSREIKNNTIRTQDIRNNQVRGRDIHNSTIRSPDVALDTLTGLDIKESRLGPVPRADSAGTAGTAALARSPVAYAHVASTGEVLAADSRGVADANVSGGGTGRYCFRGLGFSFRTAQVTIDYGDSASGGNPSLVAQVAKGNPQGDCDSGNQLEVATADLSGGGGPAPAGFYVWFFD